MKKVDLLGEFKPPPEPKKPNRPRKPLASLFEKEKIEAKVSIHNLRGHRIYALKSDFSLKEFLEKEKPIFTSKDGKHKIRVRGENLVFEIPNPDFDKQSGESFSKKMTIYEEKMAKYKEDLKKYKEDMKKYEVDYMRALTAFSEKKLMKMKKEQR